MGNGIGLYLNRSTMVDGVKTVDQHGHGISIVFQEDNTNSLHVYIYYSPWRNTSSLFHFILLQIFFLNYSRKNICRNLPIVQLTPSQPEVG